jgi:hypothetical protein
MEKERIPKPRTKVGMIGAVDHGRDTLTAAISKVMSKHTPSTRLACRICEAIICAGSVKSRQRTSILAEHLAAAKELLEKEYGKGSVLSLWNKEDAEQPRE